MKFSYVDINYRYPSLFGNTSSIIHLTRNFLPLYDPPFTPFLLEDYLPFLYLLTNDATNTNVSVRPS